MMLGDAEIPVLQINPPIENEETVRFRTSITLRQLKTKEAYVIRCQAAILLSNSVVDNEQYFDEELMNRIVHRIYKIMKDPFEDTVVLIRMLLLLENLTIHQSELIHLLVPMGIAKLVAYHARHSQFPEVCELAVQCLGEVVACCPACKIAVARTTIVQTIAEVLDNLEMLRPDQQYLYSETLRKIFSGTNHSAELFIYACSIDLMQSVLKKLIFDPAQNVDVIQNGLIVLHRWMFGNVDIAKKISSDKDLIFKLFQIFDDDEDNAASVWVLRIIGDMTILNDAKNINVFGFFNAMEEKLINNGTTYDHEILECLSYFLQIRDGTLPKNIIKRGRLWELLVNRCYSYDPKLRREALCCVINTVSSLKGPIKKEMFQIFFGRLLIDTLNGFTHENDLTFLRVFTPLFLLLTDIFKQKCYEYYELIAEYGLQEAIVKRFEWLNLAIETFDPKPTAKEELFELRDQCREIMDLIEDLKRLPLLPAPSSAPLPCLAVLTFQEMETTKSCENDASDDVFMIDINV